MQRARSLLAAGLLLLTSPSAAQPGDETRLPAPPATLGADPFYAQYADAGGIAVLGSSRVPPKALRVARDIVVSMLAQRPDLHARLARDGVRVAVMAEDEGTLDLPEQRDWKKPAPDDPRLTPCERKHYAERIGRLSDRDYWNARARGMAGPLTSAGAENLLGVPGTRYFGQNILVHEFAHMILRAAQRRDPALHHAVERAYAAAGTAGLWRGEYAAVSIEEYWAIGTQIWFNTNQVVAFEGRAILSHQDLASYDPALYAVLARVYGDVHRIAADIFYMHPARIPPGGPPVNTAEIC